MYLKNDFIRFFPKAWHFCKQIHKVIGNSYSNANHLPAALLFSSHSAAEGGRSSAGDEMAEKEAECYHRQSWPENAEPALKLTAI